MVQVTEAGARFVREQWIPALRSGNYVQWRGGLAIIDGDQRRYCCLGVACDLLAPSLGMVVRVLPPDDEADEMGEITYDGESGYLPEAVVRFLFEVPEGSTRIIDRIIGRLDKGPLLTKLPVNGALAPHLAKANDNGVTFDGIADLLDALVAPGGDWNEAGR